MSQTPSSIPDPLHPNQRPTGAYIPFNYVYDIKKKISKKKIIITKKENTPYQGGQDMITIHETITPI